jgi:(S)-ureidoglycine aminohydrolase
MTLNRTYALPPGGLLPQSTRARDRAGFTDAYAFIPASTMSDIVTSLLPGWTRTRAWIIARPLSGFAETFAQYIVEVSQHGGATNPEPDAGAEGVLFVVGGLGTLTMNETEYDLRPGSYVYIPPATGWKIDNPHTGEFTFHWIRKRYEPVPGLDAPEPFVTHDDDVTPAPMPETNGVWATSRFVDTSDLRHDMHVTIVTFQPGGIIPFAETHVMEHGLYVLQGRGNYLLNQDWVEVEPGDFMWLRAFCPQACYAAGAEPFRYLLYKDVNRHPSLTL